MANEHESALLYYTNISGQNEGLSRECRFPNTYRPNNAISNLIVICYKIMRKLYTQFIDCLTDFSNDQVPYYAIHSRFDNANLDSSKPLSRFCR